jgi:peptidoglycan hydrolase-like protein with peptidoglycan-binding domain
LRGDQATLASLQATAVNPGTTYTWLPGAGEVIRQDQRVYSVSDEPVPLLYGSIPAYRAFYAGMSDGADVGELTQDLIALGYGDGLAQSKHYSAATAAAVERWQQKLGLPATGEILLGEVVFEPGPIRVTSVTPSVGESAGGRVRRGRGRQRRGRHRAVGGLDHTPGLHRLGRRPAIGGGGGRQGDHHPAQQ